VIRIGELFARSRGWPVRVRIAIVSAALTAVILIGFAAVVGRLTSNRLHGDFEDDLQSNAIRLAAQDELAPSAAMTSLDVVMRVATASGETFNGNGTPGSEVLGAPRPGAIVEIRGLEVAAAQVAVGSDPITDSVGPLFVQYARPEALVDETIDRLWLFLGGGVAIGTMLAGLAGMAVANRAMRPIAALTSAARDIAATRDPSRRIPELESDDEVAELARTLDQMLGELDAARTETDETIERQREFVADASHELRTPLTSILANLELLDDALAGEADEDERVAIGSALRSSKRMNRLVGDLLLLAQADAGRAGTRLRTDLSTIAAEALEELAPVTAGHHLNAAIDGPAPVRGNPDELHRMVLNLLENAIRHTPPETSVRLAVDCVGARVELVVADDGPGLPAGAEEQIFGRFVRGALPADRAARNGGGTGLGLSIVRAVAQGHGGDVVAASSPGGSTFTVSLPLARTEESEKKA